MISILCSTYNSSASIDNYLKYLNDQLLENFEVIFVDANSDDGSLQKIKDYTFRDGIKKVVVECDERISIYAAWNKAITESSFEYVMNYNTDDKLFSSTLLHLAHAVKLYPHIDVIYSNAIISRDLNHTDLIGFYIWADANNMVNLVSGCCVGPFPLLKKQKVLDCGMFNPEFTISGDYEMWCRMKSKGALFIKLDAFFGVYYHNPEGVSTAPTAERHTEHLRQDTLIRETYG